jgi:Abnormal spindle-like microcephaly-assoc'd, ASPM-SPD-2-Hydin
VDWIGDLARQHGLQIGEGLRAFRYAAASDDREGPIDEAPPFAHQTRTTSVTLAFPDRPAGATTPNVEVRSGGARNAASHIDTDITSDNASATLVVTVKAAGHGGPGFDLGEIALYWAGPKAIQLDSTALDFGLVTVGDVAQRSLTVTNVGADVITANVPDGPFSAFDWTHQPPTPLPPGGSFTITIDYAPLESAIHHSSLTVLSDAPGNPHIVSLRGRAKKPPGPPN